MGDTYQPEIVRMLHSYGAWTRPRPTLPPGKQPPEPVGAADLMVHLHGGCAIEVKTGTKGGFDFKEWRENQRQWALDYMKSTGNEYFLAIVTEVSKENCIWYLRNPRVAHLVPCLSALNTIDKIPQDTFPYVAGKGYNLIMQENQWDMQHLWSQYELHWSNGQWIIPDIHTLSISYIYPSGE